MGGLLLGGRYAFEHQDKGPPGPADVDRLVARVQDQHRLLHSIARHHSPAPLSKSPLSPFNRRSTRATVSSVMRPAPARFNTEAQAAPVEPVVITSSISQ